MEASIVIAITGIVIELVTLLVGAVWLVGKIRTDSALNRQATASLKETLDTLTESSKELTKTIQHIDNRLTVVETKANRYAVQPKT